MTNMTFDVEIVLRESDYAVTERLPIRETAVEAGPMDRSGRGDLLKEMLLAIDRVKNPARGKPLCRAPWFQLDRRANAEGGVVIAIEIPMGAVVAGPFAIEQAALDRMINRVIAAAAPAQTGHSLAHARPPA